MRCCEVEARLRILGFEIPQAHGVVEGAGDKLVFTWVDCEGSDRGGMTGEIVEELSFVGVEVADAVVGARGCVDYVGGVVGEAGEVGAVFLGWDALDLFAFFGVVELERVVSAGCDEVFAVIVEVERCDEGVGLRELESLRCVTMSEL